MAALLRGPRRIFLSNPKPYLSNLLSFAALPRNPLSPPCGQSAISPPPNESIIFMVNKSDEFGVGGLGDASSGVGAPRQGQCATSPAPKATGKLGMVNRAGLSGFGVSGGASSMIGSLGIEVLKRKVRESMEKRDTVLERFDWDVKFGSVLEEEEQNGGGEAVVNMGFKIGFSDGDFRTRNLCSSGKKGALQAECKRVKGGGRSTTVGIRFFAFSCCCNIVHTGSSSSRVSVVRAISSCASCNNGVELGPVLEEEQKGGEAVLDMGLKVGFSDGYFRPRNLCVKKEGSFAGCVHEGSRS